MCTRPHTIEETICNEIRETALSCNKNGEEGGREEKRWKEQKEIEMVWHTREKAAYQGEGCISGEQRAR